MEERIRAVGQEEISISQYGGILSSACVTSCWITWDPMAVASKRRWILARSQRRTKLRYAIIVQAKVVGHIQKELSWRFSINSLNITFVLQHILTIIKFLIFILDSHKYQNFEVSPRTENLLSFSFTCPVQGDFITISRYETTLE